MLLCLLLLSLIDLFAWQQLDDIDHNNTNNDDHSKNDIGTVKQQQSQESS